jgi:hypothetical protein
MAFGSNTAEYLSVLVSVPALLREVLRRGGNVEAEDDTGQPA